MELFKKPKNMTYTEMAIYFDRHFYADGNNRDDVTLYSYLYLLCQMIAAKGHYFNKQEYYDGFSQFLASTLYMRLLGKLERGEPPVKSILNYIKGSARQNKTLYQLQAFNQVDNPKYDEKKDYTVAIDQQREGLRRASAPGLVEETTYIVNALPPLLLKLAQTSIYGADRLTAHCIYMSLLMTWLNNITLSERVKAQAEKKNDNPTRREKILEQARLKESKNKPILWRLDDSFSDYVTLLYRRSKYELARCLDGAERSLMLSEKDADAVMTSAFVTYAKEDY